MAVRYTNQAALDLEEISDFYADSMDEATAKRMLALIKQDISNLAVTPLLGQKVKGRDYEVWYALGQRYKVYYHRQGPRTIQVYRVWPSRRRPLDPSEIVPS